MIVVRWSGERLVGARSQLRTDLAQEKLDMAAARADKQVELVVHKDEAALLELFTAHRFERRLAAQAAQRLRLRWRLIRRGRLAGARPQAVPAGIPIVRLDLGPAVLTDPHR